MHRARAPSGGLRAYTHQRCAISTRKQLLYDGPRRELRKQEPPHLITPRAWIRGAKRTSVVKLKELPQGPLPSPVREPIEESDGPAYPTVLQQVLNNQRKFSHCVVITRVGNFYELYFDQAEEFAPLLNLKLAKRKTNAGPVAMAGFPYFQLDRFLKILVQDLGKHVAISEEFANDVSEKVKSGGLLFDRRVARVISPGTLIDEKFVNPWENNFLLAIAPATTKSVSTEEYETVDPEELGLAWIDLSSGDFFMQKADLSSLSSAIARVGPREIVIDESLQNQPQVKLLDFIREERHVVTFHRTKQVSIGENHDNSQLGISLENMKFSSVEMDAAALILHYIKEQLQGSKVQLQTPIQRQAEEFMLIDKHSLKALEIKTTLAENLYEGSLLHAVRKTVTKSGTRLLSQRLTSPSTSLKEISERLDLVTEMLNHPELRQNAMSLLQRSFDTLRLVQKFAFGRGDADDLIGLSRTIQVTADIGQFLADHIQTQGHKVAGGEGEAEVNCLQALLSRLNLEGPERLSKRISSAIDEDMLLEQHRIEDSVAAEAVEMVEEVLAQAGEEGLKGVPRTVKAKLSQADDVRKSPLADQDVWIMRTNASPTLTKLHRELTALFHEKEELEGSLRQKSGAKSLTLKWTPGMGYICHLKGKDANGITLDALGATRHVGSSRSTRSFHLAQWSNLGLRIEESKARIRGEEQRVLSSLRDAVIANLVHLRRNAAVLDELDVACSFATLAEERHWVRPILNNSRQHRIVGGRHPMVEAGLLTNGRNFTPNDCFVGTTLSAPGGPSLAAPRGQEQILLITGPNMAGKSTYLRQNALISILAQTGSYIPADFAELGIVDAVYSRVGSADNLYLSQSTFMLEMLETAQILRHATARSFVIMDEVGRGTTPEDGIAVSFASLWHLYHRNGCRALFATHFHVLADMIKDWPGVGCWCTDVLEDGDGDTKGWAYVHKLTRGVNRRSHALKVAKMAGLPDEAINIAAGVLEQLRVAGNDPSTTLYGMQDSDDSSKRVASSG